MNLSKFGYRKAEKNFWVGYEDYYHNELLPGVYGYYLHSTIHKPVESFSKSKDLVDKMHKIIVHRYDPTNTSGKQIDQYLDEGESRVVYLGLIESEQDLEFLLPKLGIKQ